MRSFSFLIFIFLCSCSAPRTTATLQKKDADFYWRILEDLHEKTWTKEQVKAEFGLPREIAPVDKTPPAETWIYNHPIEGFQEWAFGFNEKGELHFIIYLPAGDFASQFSLSNIEKRWANLKCEHKIKEILSPGLIKHVSYLTCENGKRYVEYNKYREVFSISIEK